MSRIDRLARIVTTIVLVATALAAIRVVVFAMSHISTSQPRLIGLYEVVPALALALVVIALFMPAATRLRVATCIGAAVLAGYVAEAALVLRDGAYAPSLRGPVPRWASGPWDTRSQLAVTLDLRARGVSAYPLVDRPRLAGARTAHLYPLAGVSRVLTVFCNEQGTFLTYTSDRYGFNNPASIWDHPGVDVALIGDSFTQGMCVDTTETIAADLSRAHHSTVNLGISGDGPLSELGILREYAPTARPHAVVWLYFPSNDFSDFEEERAGGFLDRYRAPNFRQSLSTRQSEVDLRLRAYLDESIARATREARRAWLTNVERFVTLRHVREHAFPLLIVGGGARAGLPCSADRLERFTDLITGARSEVATWGGRLYFVHLAGYMSTQPYTDPCAPARTDLLSALDRRGIPTIDVASRFADDVDERRLWRAPVAGVHYSPAGYAVVAEMVLNRLRADDRAAGR